MSAGQLEASPLTILYGSQTGNAEVSTRSVCAQTVSQIVNTRGKL